jgi:hypothetical protein
VLPFWLVCADMLVIVLLVSSLAPLRCTPSSTRTVGGGGDAVTAAAAAAW